MFVRLFNKMLRSVVLLAAAAAPAGAVTYTTASGAPDPGKLATETTFFTFDVAPTSGFSYSGAYAITTGSSKNHYAAPAGDGTAFFYTSPEVGSGTATLNTLELSTVSFYWGSVDDYNTVDVLGFGGDVLTTINGKDFSVAHGDQTDANTNQRIFITADDKEVITGLRFHATGIAYKIDNVAGTLASGDIGSDVPEPATWGLMIAGFSMIGIGARRRRGGALRVNA